MVAGLQVATESMQCNIWMTWNQDLWSFSAKMTWEIQFSYGEMVICGNFFSWEIDFQFHIVDCLIEYLQKTYFKCAWGSLVDAIRSQEKISNCYFYDDEMTNFQVSCLENLWYFLLFPFNSSIINTSASSHFYFVVF